MNESERDRVQDAVIEDFLRAILALEGRYEPVVAPRKLLDAAEVRRLDFLRWRYERGEVD